MTLKEIQEKIKQQPKGQWIYYYEIEDDPEIYYISTNGNMNKWPSQEKQESDKWSMEGPTMYKGFPVHYSSYCDKLNTAFSAPWAIVSSHNPSEQLLRHEYGHYLQRKYFYKGSMPFKVTIPSVTAFWLDVLKIKPLTYNQYYEQPWEAEANKLGGLNYYENGEWHAPLSEEEIQYILNNKLSNL